MKDVKQTKKFENNKIINLIMQLILNLPLNLINIILDMMHPHILVKDNSITKIKVLKMLIILK